MVITQKDIQIAKQAQKEVYVKIELLNKHFKIIDRIYGNILNDSLSVDSQSKQRRRYQCEIHVLDSTFMVSSDSKIWIDKYIRVYYGAKDTRSQEVNYHLIGTFTFLDMNFSYTPSSHTLSLACADLMSDYDGTKNGIIRDYKLLLEAGQDLRTAVIGLCKKAGITNYVIEDVGREIPHDLEYSDSVTYCDVWTDLSELYDSWEFFFDVDGTFLWRRIPTGYAEPVILDDTVISGLLIDEQLSTSFQNICNVTEVWGTVWELQRDDRFAKEAIYTDNVYHIALDGVQEMTDIDNFDYLAITVQQDNLPGAMVSINGLEPLPIVDDGGNPIAGGRMKSDTTYVFMYQRTLRGTALNNLYLLGQDQAHGIYKETDPNCPFSVTNLGYEIIQRKTLEKLYSDDLCYNQAEYLTYRSTAMEDNLTLNLMVLPWLDVCQKIEYTTQSNHETSQWMIKSLSWSSMSGTMTLTLYKFLESFSYIKKEGIRDGLRNKKPGTEK